MLVAGVASGVFVVAANAWMNQPAGCRFEDGRFVDVDPVAAMNNPMWWTQALHMVLAAFAAVGFGVAGVHAWALLRRLTRWCTFYLTWRGFRDNGCPRQGVANSRYLLLIQGN